MYIYIYEKLFSKTQSTNLGLPFETHIWNGVYRDLEKSSSYLQLKYLKAFPVKIEITLNYSKLDYNGHPNIFI